MAVIVRWCACGLAGYHPAALELVHSVTEGREQLIDVLVVREPPDVQ